MGGAGDECVRKQVEWFQALAERGPCAIYGSYSISDPATAAVCQCGRGGDNASIARRTRCCGSKLRSRGIAEMVSTVLTLSHKLSTRI